MNNVQSMPEQQELKAIKVIRADLDAIMQSEGKTNYSIASLKQAQTATGKAYLGLLISVSAEYAGWPGEKLKRFNEGKRLIEAAIIESAGLAEVRLIRLLVQCNCPVFLGYSSQIENDKAQLMQFLRGKSLDSEIRQYIAGKMILISCTKEQEKSELRKIIQSIHHE